MIATRILIVLLLSCVAAVAQPLLRSPVTTNTAGSTYNFKAWPATNISFLTTTGAITSLGGNVTATLGLYGATASIGNFAVTPGAGGGMLLSGWGSVTGPWTNSSTVVFPTGAGANKVWTSDANGVGSWAAASGSLATNANQFGANTTLTIKDGVPLTNANLYGAYYPGQTYVVSSNGLAVATNGQPNVGWFTNGWVIVDAEGESITAGFNLVSTTNRFFDRFMTVYAPTNFFSGTNSGLSGAKMSTYGTNFTNNLHYGNRPQGTTNGLFICPGICINDLSGGATPEAAFTTLTNYEALVKSVGWTWFLTTTCPNVITGGSPYEGRIRQFNNLVRSKRWDALYDFEADLPAPPSIFHGDGAHPNTLGHSNIAYSLSVLLQGGRYNQYPIFPRGRSSALVAGTGTTGRNFKTSHYAMGDNPGSVWEIDNGLGTGDFYANNLEGYKSGEWQHYFHIGSGNISLANDFLFTERQHEIIFGQNISIGPAGASLGGATTTNIWLLTNGISRIPTNVAPHVTVAPANLHNIAIGKGWTNDLGARADIIIELSQSDAATGDPSLAFTNTVTGEAWTNTITGGLVQTRQGLIYILDVSTNDYGSFTDISSGSGSAQSFKQAWWKLK